MEDCVFCKILNKEQEVEIIYEDDNFFVIKDINPRVKGHLLAISKKHYATLLDVPSTLGNDLIYVVKKVVLNLMDEDGSIEGFNLVQNNFLIAGQVVPHVHFHILPRRKNDGLKI
jgi:histidine triad (HIT) family protein